MAIVPYIQPINPHHIPHRLYEAFVHQPNDKITCVERCIDKLREINPLFGIGYQESFSTECTGSVLENESVTLWHWNLLVIGHATSHLQRIQDLFAKNRFFSSRWELVIESITPQGQIILGFIPFSHLVEWYKQLPVSSLES